MKTAILHRTCWIRTNLLYFSSQKLWRGNVTFQDKSLRGLEKTFQELRSKLEEIDQDVIRDKKLDFTVIAQNELNQILKSKIKLKKKTQLLLTQIGYLRINLFAEYYERIQYAQRNNELDKAVKLMNECAEIIAIPFVSTKKQPALIKRLKELLSIGRFPEPIEHVQKWKAGYEAWFKQKEHIHPQMDDKKRTEEFNQLKTAFITLYTFSFSVDNFPALRNRRSDH